MIVDGGAGWSWTCLYAIASGVYAGEGRADLGDHLVEHDAQRVQVGARVDRQALGLLRRSRWPCP